MKRKPWREEREGRGGRERGERGEREREGPEIRMSL